MPKWCVNKLENEYVAWLEEECKCGLDGEPCVCFTFDEWFEEKLEDYAESLDEEQYVI